jgi:hypothetical protein
MNEIEGKVAKIVDPYTIVINKGSEDGVEEDMRFVIYEQGDEIIDPETRGSLGKFEYVKAKVKVTYIHEKYSVAETYETYSQPPIMATAALAALQTVQVKRRELPLDEEMTNELSYTKN